MPPLERERSGIAKFVLFGNALVPLVDILNAIPKSVPAYAQTHTIETCPADKKLVRAEVVQTSALERASGKTHGELDLCRPVKDALGDEVATGRRSHMVRQMGRTREQTVAEKSDDAAVAKANLVEHLKNIDIACDDARLSAVEKIRRVKEEVEKAQDCLKRLSL